MLDAGEEEHGLRELEAVLGAALDVGMSPNTMGVKSMGSKRLRVKGSMAAPCHLVLIGLAEGDELEALDGLGRHEVGEGAGQPRGSVAPWN